MELPVLHRAGAGEEQDRLHRPRELRGTDDQGTGALGAAPWLSQPACPREIRNKGLAKEKQLWEVLLENIADGALPEFVVCWFFPCGSVGGFAL